MHGGERHDLRLELADCEDEVGDEFAPRRAHRRLAPFVGATKAIMPYMAQQSDSSPERAARSGAAAAGSSGEGGASDGSAGIHLKRGHVLETSLQRRRIWRRGG